MDRDSTITKPEAKARWQSRGWQISRNIFLTGAFYVGNGWVAGGTGWFCWWLASGSFPHSLSTSFCAVYHWKNGFSSYFDLDIYIYWLVVSTPLKNMIVSWDYYSQYMESHKIPWFQTSNQSCSALKQPCCAMQPSFSDTLTCDIRWKSGATGLQLQILPTLLQSNIWLSGNPRTPEQSMEIYSWKKTKTLN